MPEEPVEEGQENEPGDETSTIREMRETIERLKGEVEESKPVARENAFLRAGVDLESKAGQLLLKAYDGELEPDAIKAEASEIGALIAPSSEAAETPPGEQTLEPGEERSTDERAAVASGTPPEDRSNADPRDEARSYAEQVIEGGGSRADAIGEAFGMLATAGYKDGDKRVLFEDR